MNKNINWHGIDATKQISLFHYGLLIRWVSKEKSWQCIYRNPYNSKIFSYGWITEDEINEKAAEDKAWFLTPSILTWDFWLKYPAAKRIYNLIAKYGAEDIFGTDYSGGYTKAEICKQLKIKYARSKS